MTGGRNGSDISDREDRLDGMDGIQLSVNSKQRTEDRGQETEDKGILVDLGGRGGTLSAKGILTERSRL
jgi:hypothetical protein